MRRSENDETASFITHTLPRAHTMLLQSVMRGALRIQRHVLARAPALRTWVSAPHRGLHVVSARRTLESGAAIVAVRGHGMAVMSARGMATARPSNRNKTAFFYIMSVVITTAGLAYAAVPLYRLFCQVWWSPLVLPDSTFHTPRAGNRVWRHGESAA